MRLRQRYVTVYKAPDLLCQIIRVAHSGLTCGAATHSVTFAMFGADNNFSVILFTDTSVEPQERSIDPTLRDRRPEVRIPAEARDISLAQNVKTVPGAPPSLLFSLYRRSLRVQRRGA